MFLIIPIEEVLFWNEIVAKQRIRHQNGCLIGQ
jgi:hypothetical protein